LVRTRSEPSFPQVHQEKTKTVNEERQSPFFALRGVEAILEDIKDILERDDTVAADAKRDLLSDLATLKIQIGRNMKSRQIIDVVLSNLSSIPSIAPLVTGLNQIVETYFR
jgi:hypothetical protein